MSKEQIASIEYLNNKKEIDKYLDNLAENLSICIKCLLEGEQGKYIHYTKQIQEHPCPSIFKDMYVVINNILKNSFDGIENLYIYIECENSIKIDECCVTIKNNISKIIASFGALLKIIYKYDDEDEYLKIIVEKYPHLVAHINN